MNKTILFLVSASILLLSGCLGFGYEENDTPGYVYDNTPGYVVEQPSTVVVGPDHRGDSRHFDSSHHEDKR